MTGTYEEIAEALAEKRKIHVYNGTDWIRLYQVDVVREMLARADCQANKFEGHDHTEHYKKADRVLRKFGYVEV